MYCGQLQKSDGWTFSILPMNVTWTGIWSGPLRIWAHCGVNAPCQSISHQVWSFKVLASVSLPLFPLLFSIDWKLDSFYSTAVLQSPGFTSTDIHYCTVRVRLCWASGTSCKLMPVPDWPLKAWMCLLLQLNIRLFVNMTTWTSKSTIHRNLRNVPCQRRHPSLLRQITEITETESLFWSKTTQ